MVDQIRIAVIYKEEFRFLSPDYRDNTLYYFFKHALNRNKRLSIEFFLSGDKFDTKILKNKFDIIFINYNINMCFTRKRKKRYRKVYPDKYVLPKEDVDGRL